MAEAQSARGPDGAVADLGPILIVDDDAQLQRTMRWLLEDEGLVVETASNGEEALAVAEEHRPALVILDLNLPALDGEGVVEGLRAAQGPGIPVIVVSSDGLIDQRAKEIGASSWLSKPFEIDDLVAAVWRALGSN
jgi:two-component system KDP operon response regulator KdpE